MKRYRKANEGIHAPEEVKEQAARPGGRRGYARWTGAVAAVLAVAVIGGIALWPGRAGGPVAEGPGGTQPLPADDPGQPVPFSMEDPEEGRGIPGQTRTTPDKSTKSGGSHTAMALAVAADCDLPPEPRYGEFQNADGSIDYDAYWEAADPWRDMMRGLRTRLDANTSIDDFVSTSTAQILSGAGKENRVYSPLNLYMALAMLAETAGGNSRQQILDVLGADSIEALRSDAATVWQNFYEDDDMGVSVMANSLWLRDDMTYSQDTLDTLARNYYASSFAGEMGSEEYDQALRDWTNEQTRDMLTEQAEGLSFHPEAVLGLVSTLYFKSAWSDPFNPDLNTRDVFHSPSGDVEAEFLNKGGGHQGTYYWGEHFGAVPLGFQSSSHSYRMWLILPDEGCTVDDLLESGEAMEFLLYNKYGVYDEETDEMVGGWPDQKYLKIDLSLPKFDVSSDLELSGELKKLGITDVFLREDSNFDPLGASTDYAIILSQVQHAARVMIDEEGCTAASYVDLMLCGDGAPPDDEVDFTLDRPFLFAITGESDLPLFLGVVNQP